jgi:hypothetical protein
MDMVAGAGGDEDGTVGEETLWPRAGGYRTKCATFFFIIKIKEE